MDSSTLYLFPTVIKYHTQIISEKECLNAIKKCKKCKYKNHGTFNKNAVTSFDKNFSILDKLPSLKKIITEKIKNYCNELGIYEVTLGNSWVNFQFKNSKLAKHTHPRAQVSGVIYLKTDIKSSKIAFYNPNPYNLMLDKKEFNNNNFDIRYFYPKTGDLILFPGWLSHGSNDEENLSNERIALSFNAE